MQYILELNNLCVAYKGRNYFKKAINNLTLKIAQGEVFGFLGPNGAGKTTTIKSIFNFLPAGIGQIKIFGCDSCDHSVHSRMGYMPEIAQYYWYLTPRELLRMYAGFFGIKKPKQLQKVSLVQSLINDPDLLILDEPASGLDPLARSSVREIIKDLKSKGKTIFFSSHELSEVELVCDRIGIINRGVLVKTDKVSDILKQKENDMSLERYFINIIEKGEPC